MPADGIGFCAQDIASAREALKSAGVDVPYLHETCGEILFFSGGSALKGLSRAFVASGLEVSYIISTFDSGGSTAELRKAFNMPAVGDLRLRLSCLSGNDFFERRFAKNCLLELDEISQDSCCPSKFAQLLSLFKQLMPPDFNLEGAAVGNLVLAADYLITGRCLNESVQRIGTLLGAKGKVLPVSEDVAHLGVLLKNGVLIFGQHRFTGKQSNRLSSPIDKMFFCRDSVSGYPIETTVACGVEKSIAASSLICYPVGSFYSSLLANLQVKGVGKAIVNSQATKVYLPNPDNDAESLGLSLEGQLETICMTISGTKEAQGIIDFLLVDSKNGKYTGGIPVEWCRRNGVKVIDSGCMKADESGLVRLLPNKTAAILFLLSGISLAE